MRKMEYAEKVKGYLLRFLEEKKYSSVKRDKKIWVFGEWFGKRCNDNCLFLANYIVQNDPSTNVYWVACKDADLTLLSDKIKILEYDSTSSLEIFKRAGVVFMNQGYVDFSSTGYNYFRGAVTVNLWHGVAWKKIGYDASKKGGVLHEINTKIYDYFEKTSFYLSLSERYSKVLKSAFHASDPQIIRAGYPRNSYFYSSEWLKENRTKICRIISNETGLCISDKTRIIVYMPTFRDSSSLSHNLEELCEDKLFSQWLTENDAIIVQKAHFVSQQRNELQRERRQQRVITLNELYAFEALGAADILISDYSSCFFDYLVLNRPIIHFIYDYESYKRKDRGIYYDKKDVVCGKVVQSIDKLKQVIQLYYIDSNEDAVLRSQRKKEFMEFESPNSCKEIVQEILAEK